MVIINVEIISKEMIKPSSPTPIHLKTHHLSFLDQISSPIYVPFIFFYQLTNQRQIPQLLKQSLSKILTIFYPLGGRIQGNSSIDCDDSGAEFIEARVGTRLSELLEDPNVEELKKLQPAVGLLGQDETIVLKVKTSIFECGGVAIGVFLSHKVADATSFMAFINAWAATCRGETKIFNPSFDFASAFPPRSLSDLEFITQKLGIPNEKIATKRFVLDKEKLAKIFKEITTSGVQNPTRIEAVSSYICQRIMEASKAKTTPQKPYLASHTVSLRPRKSPPISEHMFGNCWGIAYALAKPEDNYSDMVANLRAAIKSINGDFIKQLENGEYLNHMKRSVDLYLMSGMENCYFTSWCSFPVYEVDFGWGKPVWVCTTTLPYKNVVILISTPCGEGIEAWVNMLEDDMKMFQLTDWGVRARM